MRISSATIRNFKGLAHASFHSLEDEPVVVISGRNGTGKSQVLSAIAALWNGQYSATQHVGPYGDDCTISMSIHLTESEFEVVNEWSQRVHGLARGAADSYPISITMNRLTQTVHHPDPLPTDEVISILRNQGFQQEHPFARLDYLPATRSLASSVTPTVDLGMFRADNVLQERREFLTQSLLQDSAMVSLPDISSYLATLDYQSLIGARQGLSFQDEYDLICKAFNDATGKRILRPIMDRESGTSGIYVEVSAGITHAIDKLSSGEKSLLGLMYFVRRVSASGGVLLLDEPEQHLHPTLQAALFESMKELADRAQVFVVSHSANLISTVPPSGLLEVRPAGTGDQILRLNDQPDKMELLSLLGLTPSQVLQADGLLAVEGKTDKTFLQALFPVEMGRVHTVVAGNSNQVLATYKTLSDLSLGIPWLCLMDRDLLTDEARSNLLDSRENLHIWEQRAIESHLLSADLVHAVMTSVGKDMDLGAVKDAIRKVVDPLQEEVLGGLVDAELTRKFPPPGSSSEGSRFDKIKWHCQQYAAVNQARADAVDAITEEQRRVLAAAWKSEWARLVDPKIALASLNSELRLFRTVENLKNALLVRARDDLSVRPPGLEALRARLLAKLDLARKS